MIETPRCGLVAFTLSTKCFLWIAAAPKRVMIVLGSDPICPCVVLCAYSNWKWSICCFLNSSWQWRMASWTLLSVGFFSASRSLACHVV